jgi:hypothetical protein
MAGTPPRRRRHPAAATGAVLSHDLVTGFGALFVAACVGSVGARYRAVR